MNIFSKNKQKLKTEEAYRILINILTLPPDSPLVLKSSYHLIDKTGKIINEFVKNVYIIHGLESESPVFIHYVLNRVGSDSDGSDLEFEYESGPHGNTKNKENAPNYERTLPSVLNQLKEKLGLKLLNVVYKEQNKKRPARNIKQCRNLRYAINKLKRFTYDAVANYHLMHISLGFPNLIVTAPTIRIIGIDEELLRETKKTLTAFDALDRVCFQFDTTFHLTGYYVSILLFIHPILVIDNSDKAPPIPLAYFFHEKKHEQSHNEFWRFIKYVLPELSEKAFIVTDCEDASRNAIKVELPLDVVILNVQQLSIYYSNEIKIGIGNRGNYGLRPQFKEQCFVDTRFVNTRDAMEPSSIIKSLILDKEELLKLAGVKFTTIKQKTSTSCEEEVLSPIELTSNLNYLNLQDSPPTVSESSKTCTSTLRMLVLKPVCPCVEKASCCHIMAVESINGVNIEQNYKISNISKLTKTKNSGSTGRNKRGHVINSIDPQSVQVSNTNMYVYENYLKEIVDEKFHHQLDKALFSKFIIQANMPMFNGNAWEEVVSTCAKVSRYHQRSKSKTCVCGKYSLECNSEN
ncbi:unnamed protein product [Brachionus calyciflorus]|uniref:SWIM-type domain-containing protein n=1 Tax=Brachionus calyciflorus TaxID=104777 RepID=A0A814K6H6_9BILA|nr:unnamed protein product [Brachionus calyciflorus]